MGAEVRRVWLIGESYSEAMHMTEPLAKQRHVAPFHFSPGLVGACTVLAPTFGTSARAGERSWTTDKFSFGHASRAPRRFLGGMTGTHLIRNYNCSGHISHARPFRVQIDDGEITRDMDRLHNSTMTLSAHRCKRRACETDAVALNSHEMGAIPRIALVLDSFT
jgi:hypothetical protein